MTITRVGEGPTFGINGSLGLLEKEFSISFSKVNKKSCLSLDYNADGYLFVNGKEILFTFQQNFDSKVFLMDLVLLEKYL